MSWMNANPQHVLEYAKTYRQLYPSSTIIHVSTTLLDMALAPNAKKRSNLGPVVDIIQAAWDEESFVADGLIEHAEKLAKKINKSDPRILLHLFSNGGAYATAQLAHAYKEKMATPLAIDVMILDSGPGTASYSRNLSAIMSPVPRASPVVRTMAYFFAHIILIGMWISRLLGLGDIVSQSRKDLNDERLISRRAPRAYLYSKEDRIVKASDVEAHALEFANQGGETRLELFDGSSHISHVKMHEEKYWNAVRYAWEKAGQR